VTNDEKQFYVAEIERLREENRRLIASEAALRARQQVIGRHIQHLAREARDELLRMAARG
jgi:hypothetical protein